MYELTYTVENGHYLADIFKWLFLHKNVWISIKLSLTFFKDPMNNIPALVQILARCRIGVKPSSELSLVSLLTNIRVTWPQWVNWTIFDPYACFVHVGLESFPEPMLNYSIAISHLGIDAGENQIKILISLLEPLFWKVSCNGSHFVRERCVNALWPSDAIWQYRTTLTHVTVWCLTGTKPLPESVSPVAFICAQSHIMRYLSYHSLK